MFPGSWKNFDDLEEHLTREELVALLEKGREMRYDQMRFTAALKGIDLDKNSGKSSFEEVRKRAMAKVHGMNEEEFELGEMGINVNLEGDEE